jgi:hypothetical protein
LDAYSRRARLAPAALAAAPELALGVALLPNLPGIDRLWSLVAFAVLPYVALMTRQLGNRVQDGLWSEWGGKPTLQRMRYRGTVNSQEVARLHVAVEGLLSSIKLPTSAEEEAAPAAADREYDSAVRQLIGLVRTDKRFGLVAEENANYGYCRNLLGLKRLGVGGAWVTLAMSVAIGLTLAVTDHSSPAPVLVLPVLVSLMALVQWRTVTSSWVRLSAEAYADRLFEAAQVMGRL